MAKKLFLLPRCLYYCCENSIHITLSQIAASKNSHITLVNFKAEKTEKRQHPLMARTRGIALHK